MNRIFRGKVKYNGNHYFSGEWVKGFYVENEDGVSHIIDNDEDDMRFMTVEVDPKTVGQCTGEKYKDGTLIWEGDKFRRPDTGSIFAVVWISGSFKAQKIYDGWLERDIVDRKEYHYIDSWETFNTELIGTIHDENSH